MHRLVSPDQLRWQRFILVTYNANNVVLSDYRTPPTNYMQWQQEHFTPAQLGDPNVSGLSANPDGDGLPNELEWALNSDPNAASSANRPSGTLDPTYLSLTPTTRPWEQLT